MKKLIIPLILIPVLAASCSEAPKELSFEWQTVENHGQITGVTAITGDIDAAIGTFDGDVYTAPSGRVFKGAPVATVAKAVVDAQPKLAYLKEVLGYSPEEMVADIPESGLSDMLADALKAEAERIWGVPMDMSIINIGGIRIAMPQGNVLLDDLKAMFPFVNTVCYAKVRGRDLRKLFDFLASSKIQPMSGVTIKVKSGKVKDVKIGGKPVVDSKLYNVATINFLLTGGDGIRLNAWSEETKESDIIVQDFMIRYIRSLTAEGKEVAYPVDGRAIVEE